MKKEVCNKQCSLWLLTNYLTFGAIGWFIWELYGIFLGWTLAYLLDRFFPRWAYELTWSEIEYAVKNHYEYGCNGSHLTFRIGKRKLHLYRDNKGDPFRIGLRIPVDDWRDVFEIITLDSIYKQYGGMTITKKWHLKDTILYFPDDELKDCMSILKMLIDAAGEELWAVSARSNCATKDIWV